MTATQIRSVINAAGAGATICFADGTYYNMNVTLNPLTNQHWVAQHDGMAILNGCILNPTATLDAGRYRIDGMTMEGPRYNIEQFTDTCSPPDPSLICGYPEQVFIDDVPQTQVATLGAATADKFFFDYAADKIYLGTNPAGKKLEIGNGLSRAVGPGGSGAILEGLVIEKYNTTLQHDYQVTMGSDWTLLGVESRWSAGWGLGIFSDCIVRQCNIHHCGFGGIGGSPQGIAEIDNTEWSFNGIDGHNVSWDGGGTKFVTTGALRVRGQWRARNNQGKGLWFDIENDGYVIEGTWSGVGTPSWWNVEGNGQAGMKTELSKGGVIHHVTTRNNGTNGGFFFHNSANDEVHHCYFDEPNAGIFSIAERYGSPTQPWRQSSGFWGHDNTIKVPAGATACGLEAIGTFGGDNGASLFQAAGNNRWTTNHYLFPATQQAYEWRDITPKLTGQGWRSSANTWLPFDTAGTWQ